jgi:RNA polymerase sigma-B factor
MAPSIDAHAWRGRAEDRRLGRLRQAGDTRARAALIERYLPLARSLASGFRATPEEMEDLVQVAALGLVKAADRWDPDRGWAFSSFAVPTILGELRHHVRDRTWCVRPPRALQELNAAIEAGRDELRALTGVEPTIGDLARHLGRSCEDVREALAASRARTASPIDAEEGDADAFGVEDAGFGRAEARATLATLVGDLDDRVRTVLHLRFDRDLIQADIGAVVGCSQFHVSRLLAASIEALHQRAVESATG